MPCSSSVNSTEDNGALCNFKLNESTFQASLMPKKEIKADRFIEAHPDFDGRGVVIAIFDSGVDPAAAGLQATSDGKPKILDVIDCTGSGDIDTSNVVKADADGCLCGASGASLVVNSSWKNPSGEWHVGCKLVYELFTDTLTSRLKKERKKKWDEKHQEAIAEAVKCLDEFDKFDEDKGKGCSTACTKSVFERLEEEVRDAKIKVLASLKQGTAEECLEWKKLSSSLKIIDAADEVIDSVDTDELAKYFSFKSDPEDEGAEKVKKKMETARDQLAEALYQKGLAMAEIESLKGEEASALASTEGEMCWMGLMINLFHSPMPCQICLKKTSKN